MSNADFNRGEQYRESSQKRARAFLEKMDRDDPFWMDRIVPAPAKSLFDWSESIFQSILTQAVCTALILCLLVSASGARVTAKALTLSLASDWQAVESDSNRE